MTGQERSSEELQFRRILETWWPLAASWLLMSVELPAISAVIARLEDPRIHLAAYGGVVFPIALVIESPIIMLLAASTALSKDWESYRRLRHFMMWTGGVLTAVHLIVSLTPLYFFFVRDVIGVPEEIVGPARAALILVTPWTWSIAYRRFNQGVLIRFGHSRAVSIGTVVRLTVGMSTLLAGYWIGTVPGSMVGGLTLSLGVMSEALYVRFRVGRVLREQVKPAVSASRPMDFVEFLKFYIPLSMTSVLTLFIQPIGSAAISRMPSALESLATWPVVSGLMFLLRSFGHAYQEVVVALSDTPGAERPLARFADGLAVITTFLLVLVAGTPLSDFWFRHVTGLQEELAFMGERALWFGLLMPALSVFQNRFQGILVHRRETRGVTEAVIVYICVSGALLLTGVYLDRLSGLHVALAAFSVGGLMQLGWVWHRCRTTRKEDSP